MSQTPKRPGTRDISELKARLGLKKAAPEKAKASGGVAPPPGLNVPGAKTGPVIPSASDDPFGNMNAMAQIGTMQRAPEIVIVHDGKPVESVSTGKRLATIGKYAALILLPLIVGWQIGAIGQKAAALNAGIDDAQKIKANVVKVKNELASLQTDLLKARKKAGGKIDPNVTKVISAALAEASFKLQEAKPDEIATPINSENVFKAKENSLGASIAGQVLVFYSHVNQLAQMMDEHLKMAKTDDLAAAQLAKVVEDAQVSFNGTSTLKYAVVLSNPGPADKDPIGGPGAYLVEIGPAFCADNSTPSNGACPGGSPQLGFRLDNSGAGLGKNRWQKADLANATAGQPFPLNQVVLLAPNPIFDNMIKGALPSASEVIYQRRLDDIASMIDRVIKEGNLLENALAPAAKDDNKKFTFFL